MESVLIILAIATIFIAVERIWPDQDLPKVPGWWTRVFFINLVQAVMVIIGGLTWEKYFHGWSILNFKQHMGVVPAAFFAYFIMTFVYYWWHRIRHESNFLWVALHQLHHSPARLETITSYYKHPLEIFSNSILVSSIVYTLCGISLESAVLVNVISSVAEFFYHVNIKTPVWVGYFIQRPEMHKIHHQRGLHYYNFGDLPIWDMLFGTFKNPAKFKSKCGFKENKETNIWAMLFFKNINSSKPEEMTSKLEQIKD